MRLALKPRAGFYTLWEAPDRAFGRVMQSSEDFNIAMIEETGVVGVHFPGCIRYAVCADVAAIDFGPCKMSLGYGVIDGKCITVGGCDAAESTRESKRESTE